jgi:hypothetical protein
VQEPFKRVGVGRYGPDAAETPNLRREAHRGHLLDGDGTREGVERGRLQREPRDPVGDGRRPRRDERERDAGIREVNEPAHLQAVQCNQRQ